MFKFGSGCLTQSALPLLYVHCCGLISVHVCVQELQRDIEQHTEGVASVLNLCDVLLRDEDAASGTEPDADSLQETSHSLDQRWRIVCAMALDRRLR